MHSHDRTLLSQLGFSDPDKRDPRHDWGCQYLALPESAVVLMRWFVPSGLGEVSLTVDSLERPRFEFPIGKGEGQYKTTIGFIDVRLGAKVVSPWSSRQEPFAFYAAAEVKITPCSAGEITRQIHLYREYIPPVSSCDGKILPFPFVIATAFALSARDIQQLRIDRCRHVFLGEKFKCFCEQQKADPPGEMFEV